MIINNKKREYIDKEIFRILGLLEVSENVREELNSEDGSLGHQIALDWSDKLVDAPSIISTMQFQSGSTIAIKECYKNQCIGFNEENYKEFQKFIAVIYKDKEVNSIISKEFIERKTFEWLLMTNKNKKANCNFSSYLLDVMQGAIEELKIHYSILYLNIGKPFKIGKVKFEFFTKEYFDLLIENYSIKHPEKIDNPYKEMRAHYQGKVYATYEVKAERGKAEEIAYEQCCLAVDILKMCSDTIDVPNIKLSFDIDSRTKENAKNEVIFIIPTNLDSFTINLYMLPNHHRIYKKEWQLMEQRQLKYFHKFLLTLTQNVSELEQLIINAIKRYGNAISNSNLHQRVIDLFTILESLLLLDKNSPIIESVCKYCSKLVFKAADDRRKLIDLLKDMYNVRSALIHHAKEMSFEINNLRILQKTVIDLLAVLIIKTTSHQTKLSLLQEIDDAILKAY